VRCMHHWRRGDGAIMHAMLCLVAWSEPSGQSTYPGLWSRPVCTHVYVNCHGLLVVAPGGLTETRWVRWRLLHVCSSLSYSVRIWCKDLLIRGAAGLRVYFVTERKKRLHLVHSYRHQPESIARQMLKNFTSRVESSTYQGSRGTVPTCKRAHTRAGWRDQSHQRGQCVTDAGISAVPNTQPSTLLMPTSTYALLHLNSPINP